MFGKYFASTFEGSMYGAGAHVFAVWGYIVANARPPGELELNPRKLGDALGMKAEEVQKALEYLSAPDPESRNADEDGRRIVRLEQFKWRVVSFNKYRKKMNLEERREYNRIKKRESRERERNGNGQHQIQGDATHGPFPPRE